MSQHYRQNLLQAARETFFKALVPCLVVKLVKAPSDRWVNESSLAVLAKRLRVRHTLLSTFGILLHHV